MQNERVKLPIKGINRKIPGAGHCDEIINLRNNMGVWETMGKKDVLHDLSEMIGDNILTHWYKHPVTPDDWFLCYMPIGSLLLLVKADTPTSVQIHNFPDDEVVSKIYHFGYILIVVTNIDTYYFKYDADEQEYTLLPPLEHGMYAVSTDESTARFISRVYYQDHRVSESNWEYHRNMCLGFIGEEKERDDGYVNGHALFRLAFKTADGNYIMPTTPLYSFIGQNNFTGEDYTQDRHDTPQIYTIISIATTDAHYFKLDSLARPILNYVFTSDQLDVINKYDGFITNLCVFMTNPKHDRDFNCVFNDLTTIVQNESIEYTIFPYSNDINDYLKTESLYYLVEEIDIRSLTQSSDVPIPVKGLVNKPTLPVDNFSHHKLLPNVVYELNSRLHYGSPTTLLSQGHNLSLKDNFNYTDYFKYYFPTGLYLTYYGDQASVPYEVHTIVKLKTDKGTNTLIKKYDDFWVYQNKLNLLYILINQVISYPDKRAMSIQFCIKTSGQYRAISDELELKSHEYLNIAYYVETFTRHYGEYTGTTQDTDLLGLRTLTFNAFALVTTGEVLTPTENRYYIDTNRVQVSALSSFLYFPAENSYRVGKLTNEVVSLMSQAQPLSEGQFGMFPLYVFTTNGIYALEQGENDVLYKSIQPVSLDVAVGEAIPVLDGVIFPSQKGIMVLTGRRTTCISEPLHAKPLTEMPLAYYDNLVNGTDDVITTEALSLIDFRDYIKDAIITYDYMTDEVIVSSTKKTDSVDLAYKYSYVYSIKQGVWYKTDEYYEELFGKYGYLQGVIYDLSTETDILRPILIKTTPFTFGNLVSFDRIAARFRGNYSKTSYIAGSIGKCALYLYGSLSSTAASPTSFHPVSGIKTDAALVHSQEVMLRRSRTTARWFILVFAINSSLGVIDEFEADIVEKYANRIR